MNCSNFDKFNINASPYHDHVVENHATSSLLCCIFSQESYIEFVTAEAYFGSY